MSSSTHDRLREQIHRAHTEHAEFRRIHDEAQRDGDERRARLAESKLSRLGEEIQQLEERQRGMLRAMVSGSGGMALQTTNLGELGEALSDPEVGRRLAELAHSSARLGDVILGSIPRQEAVSWAGGALRAEAPGGQGLFTETAGMIQPTWRGIIPALTPQPSLLDLIPSATLDAPFAAYAAEQAVEDGAPGPAPVVPGAMKPPISIQYVDKDAAPTTVAGWIKLRRQSLADVPQLAATIQTRLTQKLRARIEQEVLSGDGSVSDRPGHTGLVGILNTDGIITADAAGSNGLDALQDAIAGLLTLGAQPNVVCLHPQDWSVMQRAKAEGSGVYFSSPFTPGPSSVWGVTVTTAAGLPRGTGLVMDTRMALTLLWRENVNVRVGEESDDMVRNRATLLSEARVALAVWIPSAVCVLEHLGGGEAETETG